MLLLCDNCSDGRERWTLGGCFTRGAERTGQWLDVEAEGTKSMRRACDRSRANTVDG